MSGQSFHVRRRAVLQAAGVLAVAAGLPRAAAAAESTSAAPDPVAETYHRVLLRHTRWAEQQFDSALGYYRRTDFSFAVVLGNALLLTRGRYDASLAGVDRETLRAHTLATIRHFAASNVVAGGSEWGQTLFFDTTFQSYFVLAARLLWTELDDATRADVDRIVRGQAAYTASLGTGNDPRSGSWTPNGLTGGYQGDTKLEEMGVYAQSLAPALAWAADDPDAPRWRELFGRWSRNETGLPASDLATPTLVDGVPVSDNTATNLYDTFIVENHGSFGPHYQEELWRTSGRNAIHFLLAGRPLPEVLTRQPNGEALWRTILLTMSDAGEPLMPMVDDREHLYGRDVLPLAFRSQVLGDALAARAEAELAARLEPYQDYAPATRITKFSGEPKYEPEARAELAISYLLHEWRATQRGAVTAVSRERLFADSAGVRDFGAGPGLVAQQSAAAWAGAVSKPGFTKFAWQPGHDDWLFALGGGTPMFLPSTGLAVTRRTTQVYRGVRDGFDGSVTVLSFATGRAGFATLPTGSVVYASTGLGDGEGCVSVHNLTMPGVPGLDGDRTYTFAEGTVSIPAADARSLPPGVSRVDDLTFPVTAVRYVRMLGVTPHPVYGYSLFEVEVRNGADGPDLALGGTATASSADTGRAASYTVDGSYSTRWAVSRADRSRADSWLSVDLGSVKGVDRVRLFWETAAGSRYVVQGSVDGSSWRDLASYPDPDVRSIGGWLAVDDRASFVVRGPNPLTVQGDRIVLSDGPAAPVLVEGHVGRVRPGPAPVASGGLRASLVDGYLVVFNLGDTTTTATVTVPLSGEIPLYEGTQRIGSDGSVLTVTLEAGTGRVFAPRFHLDGRVSSATVYNGQSVELSGPRSLVQLTAGTGRARPVAVSPRGTSVVFPEVPAYPLDDLALGCDTFPAPPVLPPGMTDPAAAVDGDARTSWTPGPGGRMVVDLGRSRPLREVVLTWAGGRLPAVALAVSDDGRTYTPVPVPGRTTRRTVVAVRATGRYLAVSTPDWRHGDAPLTSVSVR
ncbi:F5/8 type C domain-containing protein [Amycolatopsis sacchari]|uniref:F5/8 type C domain-containing protein n=1 Tax=Amycolatopsis sacchari TaxID=115433 RepID=A0A1I3YC01_9PSEU|nr:discoidin domain-containing protein [Amycolatopsis sacchari]SFK29388.1 F5/8 type C domain-containing protein [Amycolatopsis sacchari]